MYNDKELEDDGGLNWYDYGYRSYDAQVGRFVGMDQLTDYQAALTPYHYAYNDLVNFTDYSGLIGIPCPGTSALTIFFEKAGEVISNVSRTIQPIENILSLTVHLSSDAGLIDRVVEVNQAINKQLTGGVGSMNANNGNSGGSGGGNGSLGSGGGQQAKNPCDYSYKSDYSDDPINSSDQDQFPHPKQENPAIRSYREYEAVDLFELAFEGATHGGADPRQIIRHFEHGDGSPLHFPGTGGIGQHVLESPDFIKFAVAFEEAFAADIRKPFNGNKYLNEHPWQFNTRNIVTHSESYYLKAVIGGFKQLAVQVSIRKGLATFSYTISDEFGAGIDDSWRDGSKDPKNNIPGVPEMYYLQHYHGDSNHYRPFKWDVNVQRTSKLSDPCGCN